MSSLWQDQLFVVAEIGMTHDGSFGLCKQLTQAAIDAGAKIIKYQWHIAEEETRIDAPSPPYFTNESRFEYFKRTEFSSAQFAQLVKLCRENKVLSCVSVFSNVALNEALKVDFDVIKIASGEVTNKPLLTEVNRSGKPVILSSGMSSWEELDRAVHWLRDTDLCVLQCTSMYPTPAHRVGLNMIDEIAAKYGLPVGLSDHTLGIGTAIAAVTLGATVIEKHFTLSKRLYGPDAKFSLDACEFTNLSSQCQFVFDAMRQPVESKNMAELGEMKVIFEKSIVARHDIKVGETLDISKLSFKKPGNGIPAARYEEFIGQIVKCNLKKDDYILEQHLQKNK